MAKKIPLHWQIIIGIILAVLYGYFLSDYIHYVKWMGVIFMRALKMIVVPLVLTSLITGVTRAGSKGSFGKLGLKTMVYYLSTSLLAILTGLFLVNIIQPGKDYPLKARHAEVIQPDSITRDYTNASEVPDDTMTNAFSGLIANPDENPGDTLLHDKTDSLAMAGFQQSKLLKAASDKADTPGNTLRDTLINIIPENIFQSMTLNGAILSVIFFALLTGIFITRLKKDHRNLLTDFFQAFFELMMKITLFIIGLAPFGIFGLVAGVVAEQDLSPGMFSSLGKYMLTVVGGLLFHVIITLPLILFIIGRINPLSHYKAMITPLLTAFSTASSNATLPVTIETVEKKAGVSNRISGFTLPLGATINMDGTALYELVVAGFVAQMCGIELSFAQQFILVATALLASIGTAAIPMASYVTMFIIFEAVGLNFEYVALVLVVDRPLDMLRTATNVFSDTCGAVTIAASEGEDLQVKLRSKTPGSKSNKHRDHLS